MIRGSQVGLRDAELVDLIKAEMRSGTYRFASPEGQIGGILDRQGIYHVMEGHHRTVAALELFGETGDDHFINELMSGEFGIGHPPRQPVDRCQVVPGLENFETASDISYEGQISNVSRVRSWKLCHPGFRSSTW